MISSDSIYLITGCHKASSWSLAAFHDSEKTSNFNLRFTAGNTVDGNATAEYRWAMTTNIPCRIGPYRHDGKINRPVFIHGSKLAIRQSKNFPFTRRSLVKSYQLPKPTSNSHSSLD
ncbi:hypothetical protein EDC04DRAFT_2731851, partial [Pisolithus marmoratus]